MKQRVLRFHYLITYQTQNGQALERPASRVEEIISHINGLGWNRKCMDIADNKFFYLESYTATAGNIRLVFVSARNKYRADLINRRNGNRRTNPKTMDEGETEKTHMLIRVERREVKAILEQNHLGVSMDNIQQYLNRFADEVGHLGLSYSYNSLVNEDVLDQIRNSSRVVETDLYVTKRILGSRMLNFSNRTANVKNSLVIKIKPERGESIRNFAIDCFNKLNARGQQDLERIVIRAKDQNNNNITIDTSFIEKRESVSVTTNSLTGEIQTPRMFTILTNNLVFYP